MVRIDMGEYQEKHTVSRLIGAPPGYVGYEEGGQLTEPVRRRPYSVILFDEIEKAHPEVFNVLLQVLDDGRLTDGQGRTVDFSNTVIIMTSNLGTELWSADEEPEDVTEGAVRALLARHFRPEFLNRIDEIVVFHRLTRDDLTHIVEIQLRRVAARLKEQGLELDVTEPAKVLLADRGYDPVYGARPLKRTIQRQLQDPLALQLIAGVYQPGDVIRVEPQGEELHFEPIRQSPAVPLAE
jgi:ATP-dependent Clp protease ATP-binding subunit ClpB